MLSFTMSLLLLPEWRVFLSYHSTYPPNTDITLSSVSEYYLAITTHSEPSHLPSFGSRYDLVATITRSAFVPYSSLLHGVELLVRIQGLDIRLAEGIVVDPHVVENTIERPVLSPIAPYVTISPIKTLNEFLLMLPEASPQTSNWPSTYRRILVPS